MIAHYDNSAENLLNPDPTETVYWGDQTWQEMMIGSLVLSRTDQDLRQGPPRLEPLGDDRFRAHFRYKRSQGVDAVYLAGSFNEWKQHVHRLEGPDQEGFYNTFLDLNRGEYEYNFVLNGDVWKDDPGNREHKGYFHNSVLRVE